jgi:peptide/nickel transport system ATP-binding protein
MTEPLLSVRGLSVDFVTADGRVRGVDRISLDVARGEIVGIAGESASGKSTLAQAILRILPPPAVITAGEVIFEGKDLLRMTETELAAVRWKRLSIVLQSSLDALNPVLTIGEQLMDTLRAHGVTPDKAKARAAELLDMVDIPAARLRSHPHELSGGMRQRVAIALSLALEPALVILDEPTTALDVLVERDVLALLLSLRARLGFAVIFITHDLGRMSQVSDRIAVLYSARIIEVATMTDLIVSPKHPYTQSLLRAMPAVRGEPEALVSIPGSPPSLKNPPPGCRFHPRCDKAIDVCRTTAPALVQLGKAHLAACHVAAKAAEVAGDVGAGAAATAPTLTS